MQADTGCLEHLEIMPSTLATERANDPSSGLLNHQLALEGVALLLARIKPALMVLGTLNRSFGNIDDYHRWLAKASD